MSSRSSQSGESIDNSSETTATSSESQRKLWERLPTDVNWFGRLVEFNCNGNALDDHNGSSRGSLRSQNADAGSDMNRSSLSEVLPNTPRQRAELRFQNYLRSPQDSDSDLQARVRHRVNNLMLSLSPSPSTYNHRFIDDLQNYMQDFEMRLNADLDLHYAAIGTPDSIEAVSDTSPTSDGFDTRSRQVTANER